MEKGKSPFRCKNGRKFQTSLTKAARGDRNVGTMFTDNMDKDKIEIVREFVINDKFIEALGVAFEWEKSNEGFEFWKEVLNNI